MFAWLTCMSKNPNSFGKSKLLAELLLATLEIGVFWFNWAWPCGVLKFPISGICGWGCPICGAACPMLDGWWYCGGCWACPICPPYWYCCPIWLPIIIAGSGCMARCIWAGWAAGGTRSEKRMKWIMSRIGVNKWEGHIERRYLSRKVGYRQNSLCFLHSRDSWFYYFLTLSNPAHPIYARWCLETFGDKYVTEMK